MRYLIQNEVIKDLAAQERIKQQKQQVQISEKFNLTIDEASQYFNIGRDKLYAIAKENGCKFVLYNGRNILIKRKQFEKFLEQNTYI